MNEFICYNLKSVLCLVKKIKFANYSSLCMV